MNFVKSILRVSPVVIKPSRQPFKVINCRNIWTKRVLTEKSSICQFRSSTLNTSRWFHGPVVERSIHHSNSLVVVKKRPARKKQRTDDTKTDGKFNVIAYGTAEEYDLEALHTALTKQDLYETKKFYTEGEDVLHVRSKYNVELEPRDIFFFREGSVVMWNLSENEAKTLLRNIEPYEIGPYPYEIVKLEKEVMTYAYVEDKIGGLKNETFLIQPNNDGDLEKYTFSNAMTSSVKLGIWEATLEKYIDGLASVTADLKEGRKIRMSRSAVLRKTGELFALKHLVNLDSDLLETPDFYWDREELERLFAQTCTYFSISKRKRVRIRLIWSEKIFFFFVKL